MKKHVTYLAWALPMTLIGSAAHAEIVGNIAVSNNYVWRGVTQTGDQAAVSGGLDYSHASGAYVGTWVSNVGFAASETDLYAGFSGEAGPAGYDVGYIYYAYPGGGPISFGEIYASGSYGPGSLGVAFTTNSEIDSDDPDAFVPGDIYINGGVDLPIPEETGLGLDSISLFAGVYLFDEDDVGGAELNYTHYGIHVAKSDFTFGIEINTTNTAIPIDDDGNPVARTDASDPRLIASWGKEF